MRQNRCPLRARLFKNQERRGQRGADRLWNRNFLISTLWRDAHELWSDVHRSRRFFAAVLILRIAYEVLETHEPSGIQAIGERVSTLH